MEKLAPATRVYRKCDWLAFTVTFAVVFSVYCFTVGPDVDLESSGMYATAAMHAGVGCPPGYPHWTMYAWLFAHGLPFGTIAWRIAISSALAGAVASGLIALMGSKTAGAVIEEIIPTVTTRDLRRLSVVSGCVGAMAFAFSSDFWGRAIIVDMEAFNVLLFCIVLALLMRWIFQPTKRKYLYAAFVFYGLTIVSGQSFLATSVGMQLLVICGDRSLGRDLLLVNGSLLLFGLFLKWLGWFPMLTSTVLDLYLIVTAITLLTAAALIVMTRKAFTEWKAVVFACSLFTIATLTYLIVPILSMTNPPANWSYARTVEGFFHLLTRGQFERLNPTSNVASLFQQLKMYAAVAYSDFGWYYLPFAVGSLLTLKRVSGSTRGWVIGLSIVFTTTIILMIEVLNPSTDRQTLGLVKSYFTPSYIVLAILTAIGLAIFAATITKPPNPTASHYDVSN